MAGRLDGFHFMTFVKLEISVVGRHLWLNEIKHIKHQALNKHLLPSLSPSPMGKEMNRQSLKL